MPSSARGLPVIVVMGVSAVGKSSVANALADALAVPFVDADHLHPTINIAKMASGVALTDDDRWPWLDIVAARLAEAEHADGIVIACSALRRSYRDRLRAGASSTAFVHLTGSPELLAARAAARTGHFMPPALLLSQLEALESLGADERGIAIDVAAPLADVVSRAVSWVRTAAQEHTNPAP